MEFTKICSNAFQNCSSLIEVTIPSSVNKIEYKAFDGCNSLKQISIPSSVKYSINNTFPKETKVERID